ncbi:MULTISPECIES: beta strand repeat-containing protein [unclassified Variovorax]|uniref:beta strand repeat-containing protein n=1 Tax=unclassified Variovorax TaxID=663243 RepID=UPI0013177717|nr:MULTISPECIES: invasin domain 3-containing protein [unclassified Variovorax]VTU42803.1 Gamma-intimin [Variovorax sp. PBL-H6]VTU43668.1 Gamma-intimin [Variovorax sp. SRS16]VTU43731.1 Gamma-intimin [Variovorax sp. PBL-E5]
MSNRTSRRLVTALLAVSLAVQSVAAAAAGAQFSYRVPLKTMNVIPDYVPATGAITSLTADPPTVVAGSSGVVTLTASVADSNGRPAIDGETVAWATSGGDLGAGSATVGGAAVITLAPPTVAGPVTVSALLNSSGASLSTVVDVIADEVSAKVAQVSAPGGTLPANGSAQALITASVTDDYGNPLGAGIPVTWSTDIGTLTGTSSSTDANGMAATHLTAPTTVGIATVRALAANSGDAGKTAGVSFIADAATSKVVSVTADRTFMTANGSATATLSALLRDANGNLAPAGTSVSWGATLGNLAPATSSTDAAGRATAVLTAGTVSGTSTVTARGASGDAGKTQSISLDADATTARVVSLSTNATTAVANGAPAATLSAAVLDAHGNRVTGATVDWTTTLGSIAASSTTGGDGIAHAVLNGSTVAGAATVRAKTRAGGDAGQTQTVTFSGDAATARVTAMSSNAYTAVANGAPAVTLSATLKDANGNLLPGAIANWTTSLGTIAATTAAGADGVTYAVLYAGVAAGTATVRVKGAAADAGQATYISLIGDVTTARPVQVVASPSWVCGSVYPDNITTTLYAVMRDANGNVVVGAPVTWAVDRGSLGVGQWGVSYSDANGTAVSTLTSSPEWQVYATATAYGAAGQMPVNVYYEYCKPAGGGGK